MAKFTVNPDCKECKGTGQYIGLWMDVGPCKTCAQQSEGTDEAKAEGKEEAPVHRCARAARALTPTQISPAASEPEPEPEYRSNVGLKDTWKKLFATP